MFYAALALILAAWLWLGLCYWIMRPWEEPLEATMFSIIGKGGAWLLVGVGVLLLVLSTIPRE